MLRLFSAPNSYKHYSTALMPKPYHSLEEVAETIKNKDLARFNRYLSEDPGLFTRQTHQTVAHLVAMHTADPKFATALGVHLKKHNKMHFLLQADSCGNLPMHYVVSENRSAMARAL